MTKVSYQQIKRSKPLHWPGRHLKEVLQRILELEIGNNKPGPPAKALPSAPPRPAAAPSKFAAAPPKGPGPPGGPPAPTPPGPVFLFRILKILVCSSACWDEVALSEI